MSARSLSHLDPEPQFRQTGQESPGPTRQEGPGAGVFVHREGVRTVPERVLWKDCRGKRMKRTKTQRHRSCRGNARSMFLSVTVDFGCRVLS